MTGNAEISRTTAPRDPRKMPVTRGRLAVVAALSALAVLAAGCGSGGSTTAHAPASPASPASHTYDSKNFKLPLTVTVGASLESPPETDFPTFLTWDAVSSSSNKVRFLVSTNLYHPGSFASQAPPKNYLKYLRGLTSHGVTLSHVVKITVDGHPATLMTVTSSAAAGPPGFFDGTVGCPDPASDQEEGCFGFQPDVVLRLAVIPVGGTTLLAWARTSKAHPDEAFFAMFEKMLTSVRFRW